MSQFDLFNGAPPIESQQKFVFGEEIENDENSLMLPSMADKQKRMVQGRDSNVLFQGGMVDDFEGHFAGAHDETARNLLATVDGRDGSPGTKKNKKAVQLLGINPAL